MTQSRVSRSLRNDLGSAVLALALAVAVWVNATYQNDKPHDDVFSEAITIENINVPSGLIVTNSPESSVRIKIRAFASSWEALSSKSFQAVADWTGVSEGAYEIPIKITCSDRTVTILSVQPKVIEVVLEPLSEQTLPVQAGLDDLDELPLGYAADLLSVSPDQVVVEGPASKVQQVASVEAGVSLAGQRESGERTVDVSVVDKDGHVVTGVTVNPKSVTISYDVQKKLNYREVAVQARTTGNPAKGYFISSLNVDPSTVTVVGPPAVIATMSGLVSVEGEVDVTNATRMVAERLPLDLPDGVSVLTEYEGQSQEVLVTVEIEAVMGGTTLEVPLTTRKLGDGLVATLSVPAVDVIVTGPAVLLDELQISLLDAYVDLSGLEAGTHQVRTIVDILVSQNPNLADLQVTSISPAYVEADIREVATPTPTTSPTSTRSTPTPTRGIPRATLAP